MHRVLFAVITILILSIPCIKAQEVEEDSTFSSYPVVFADLMAFGGGVYFEYVFSNHASIKIGANYVYLGEQRGSSFPIMLNYIDWQPSGMELGIGVGAYNGMNGLSIGGGYHKQKSLLVALSVGYRIYNKEKHLLYRFGVEFPANFCYMLHFSLGFSI